MESSAGVTAPTPKAGRSPCVVIEDRPAVGLGAPGGGLAYEGKQILDAIWNALQQAAIALALEVPIDQFGLAESSWEAAGQLSRGPSCRRRWEKARARSSAGVPGFAPELSWESVKKVSMPMEAMHALKPN
jgi:hypothetical protein